MAYDYKFSTEGSFDNSEDFEYKEKGYKLLKEDKIKCSNCKRSLVEIVKVKENNNINELKASCPFCGNESFVYRINGQIFIRAANDVCIQDMPVDIIENVIKTHIKVIKNVKK